MIEAGAVYVAFMTEAKSAKDLVTEANLVSAIYRSMQAKSRGRGIRQSA